MSWCISLGLAHHTQEWLRRASPSHAFRLHLSLASLILLHQRQLCVYFRS